MNAIAVAELKLLARNRLVAGCALLFPLAFGAVLYFTGNSHGNANTHADGASLAGLQIIVIIAMGTYITATTTLAARRQTLYLKRMRGAAISDRAIIAGLLTPLIAVNVTQLAIVLGVQATTNAPADLPLLIVAILIAEAMFAGLALATAGFSASPEHAQYTTMPIFFTATAAAIWIQISGTGPGSDHLIAVKRALPGGALTELITTAWTGGSLSNVPLLLVPSIAWAAIGVAAARTFFRWEPRR